MTARAPFGYRAAVRCGWLGRWSGVWALLAGFALPNVARAEEKARLVYVRGEGAGDCPAEVDLRLWVMARLGYDPFSPQASRVVIARVEMRERQLFGSVEVADRDGLSTGRRELSSKNERCQELARAMALSISLSIDPERATQAREAPVPVGGPARPAPPSPLLPLPPPPPAPASPSLAPPPVPASVARKPQPTPFHVVAGGAFESGVGQLPGLGLGGALGVGWRAGAASLALEGHGAFTLGDELAPRGSLIGSRLVAGLAGCARLGVAGLCAVGYVGQQRLGTRDVAQPNQSSALYLGFGPRLVLELPLTPRLTLTVGLESVLNATRNRALLTGREVWRAPVLGAALSTGVAAHFL